MGLSQEQIATLFTPFSQADGSISRNFGGTGLGLAISKRLVTMMGGEFEVHSRPGQGSTFTFTAVLAVQQGECAPSHAPPDLQGLRVLVVEDHPATSKILSKALESFSFVATVAESGEQGLQEFRRAAATETPFDLLLLDYRLPGINGEAVARAVREVPASGKRPKILMLSSLGAAKIVEGCLAAGCDRVIDKPVSRAALLTAIITLYDNHQEESPAASHAKRDGAHRRLAGARVLVVEDNHINQLVSREILEKAGVLVDMAENGDKALEAVFKNDYQLVLMDIQMPGMDGLQATRIIRASGIKRLAELPIVAMTAHAIKGDEEVSLAAGMNDHITKPIAPQVLYATMEKWLTPKQGPSAASVSQGTHSLGSRELPQRIPGIDLELAMTLLGDAELVRHVLRQFVAQYTGEADRILEQLRERHWDEACRSLHSLKGVVGTICAQELYPIVVELENKCLGQQAPSELLAAFKEAHERLVEGLKDFVPLADD
jgi:CheY-like chemotaxis protein/HPt (histidine-containing phosphotransfer) domain-containing protein